MVAFNCLIFLGLLVHLVSSDVSLTIGSNQQNVRSEQNVRSNYEAPRGYDYSGSYSTVAPENKAQYVGYYSTAAPDNKAQYVGSYSTGAPDKAQYVGSYSTAAPDNKAQYVGSYSSGSSDKAQYVGSYSTAAPDNQAQYVGSYSGSPNNKGQYVASFSAAAPDNKAQYVGSYSAGSPNNKGQYVASFSSVAPDNKAQYVGSYSSGSSDKAQYVGSYSNGANENKAQYVASSSSRSSYDPSPSGQISSDRQYYSARQEYNPQYQDDRGVLLISKELQVPFVTSKKNDNSDCDEAKDANVNQQVQLDQNNPNNQTSESDEQNEQNNQTNQNAGENDQNDGNVENNEPPKPVYKTSKYEVRRPGIRKEFYDIEEKVLIRPAGSAIFELQHDKPHTAAIVNKHISQQQSYPQYAVDDSQYYPQEAQYANHAYNPVIIQSVPSNGYDYNPGQAPPSAHIPYPTYNYNPVYPSTTVTSGYVPPVAGGYLPPCEETPSPPSKPPPPHSAHELSDEQEQEEEEGGAHDYDSDAAFITPIKEENQEFVDITYAPSKSNSNRNRENYRLAQSPVYNSDSRIDRVRVEYQNQRGDLAQQKYTQYPQEFHQEYVPNLNVNERRVQIRYNGAPPAKYTQEKASSPLEIQNSQRLLDLYSANGDVTEVGFGGNAKSQQYQDPTKNVKARVVSVTPAPQYANYVDEQTKSRRVVLSKPLYTVQQVEVREHNHRLVEDVESDSIEPKVSEFEKLRLIGNSAGKASSSQQRQAELNSEVEYITPVPQEYAHLRAGSPVPDTLQK